MSNVSLLNFIIRQLKSGSTAYLGMNFSLLLNAIFFSISVGFYSSATAQFPPQISNDQLAVNSEKKLKINMNNVDIKQVIQWMGEQTKKNFIVDPRVKGRVIVYSNQSMTLSEAYQVFLTMLDVHGFAAVQSGNNIKILPNAQARSAGIPIIEQFSDTKADNSELVIHIIKINNLSPEKIVSTLRPLVPQAGHLAALPESSSIIIADRANNINRLSELIRHLDVSGDLTIKVIAIKHASAEDIVKLLQSLIKETKTGIIQVAVDIRSNSILLAGAGDRQEAVENLIAQLDRPLQGNGNTKVIFLNYINAEDIEPLLSSVAQSIQGSQEITPDNSEVKIQASTTTNALVITAPPSIITSLEKVITKLDVKRSQVLIEAIIVEVSEAFTKELEVFWTNNADSQSLVSGNFLSSTSNTPANVQNNPSTLLNQDGLNLGFFKDADIRGLLKMIKTDSRNNVLSTPSIITIDNEEAQMLVGKTVPFVTGSRLTGSTNNVNSSYAIPYRTIQREDVGITLKITPKISKAGTITLEIDQEVESVTETQISSEGISTNKRSIKTNVLIENGRILVLGGLIEESKTVNKTKIPILGDIPLLGALFRGTSETISKQNLMVFIKPTIIDDLEVADQRTREKYKLIQKQQIEGIDNKEIAILPKIETLESPAVK